MRLRQFPAAEFVEALRRAALIELLLAVEDIRQFLIVVDAENVVDLRDLLGQLRSIALAQAAADDEFRPVRQTRHVEDRIDGLDFGVVDEAAGVHQDNLGLAWIGNDLAAGFLLYASDAL